MVGFIDVHSQLNGVPVNPQKGHHRSAPSLDPEGRKRLNIKTIMEKGNRKDFGCHHCSLATSPMKSDLNHPLLRRYQLCYNISRSMGQEKNCPTRRGSAGNPSAKGSEGSSRKTLKRNLS